MKRLFITLYGVNNTGKSLQCKMLADRLESIGEDVKSIKYPDYSLKPTGPLINQYLREGNPLNLGPREAQIIYALNRTQLDNKIREELNNNHIISEDYSGTSIAWGSGSGIDKDFLVDLNSHLLEPDKIFLIDGVRYREGVEAKHKHENDDELSERVANIHRDLGKEFNWIKIDNKRTPEEIHRDIWKEVEPLLN